MYEDIIRSTYLDLHMCFCALNELDFVSCDSEKDNTPSLSLILFFS